MRRAFANKVDNTEKSKGGRPRTRFQSSVRCSICAGDFLQWPEGIPKFCSRKCAIKASSIRLSRKVDRKCRTCNATFTAKDEAHRNFYCSRECWRLGKLDHWFEPCRICQTPIKMTKHYRDVRNAKYCSVACYGRSVHMRGHRKDGNHNEIAELFEKAGFLVIDMSGVGNGIPDLTICFGQVVKVVEIKNPKTAYGRKGLNKRQKTLKERGFPMSIVTGVDQALEFIRLFKALQTDKERHQFLYPQDVAVGRTNRMTKADMLKG